MPSNRVRLAWLALCVVCFSAACFQGGAGPRPALAPGTEPSADAPLSGRFGVVFGAPRGELTGFGQVTLVFNRPMQRLEIADAPTAEPPVILRPAVPGRWQWVGTSALVFLPTGSLPQATEYSVEVPAGTRSLDGSTLAEPYRLAFTSRRPAVTKVEPNEAPWSDLDERLDRDAVFTLRFNQAITDTEAARAVAVIAGGSPVPFAVRRPDPANERLLVIAPRSRLPLDSPVEVKVDASLRGKEGPLPSGREHVSKFKTYGPLRILQASCTGDKDRCEPEYGLIRLTFSNPVKVGDVRRVLSVDPPLPLEPRWDDDEKDKDVFVDAKFAASTKYRIRIPAGIQDEHGQALAAAWDKEFVFEAYRPKAALALEGSTFESPFASGVPVASMNLPAFDLATAPLNEQAVLAMARPLPDGGYRPDPSLAELAGMPGGKRSRVEPKAGLNAAAKHLVRAEDMLGKGRAGSAALALSYSPAAGKEAVNQFQVVHVTDLAISAKLAERGSLVRVTRLSSGAPVEGASVSLQRPDAKSAPAMFRTDKRGYATIPAKSFVPDDYDARPILFARLGDDWTYRLAEQSYGTWNFGLPYGGNGKHAFGLVFTERPIYRPGDVVKVKGIFRKEGHPVAVEALLDPLSAAAGSPPRGTETPAGRPLELKVNGPDYGAPIVTLTRTLTPFGTFSADVKIPETAKLGRYRMEAEVDGESAQASSSFEVAEYQPATFGVTITGDKPTFTRGETATWTARGDYLFGAPMPDAEAQFIVFRRPIDFSPPGLDDYITDSTAARDPAIWRNDKRRVQQGAMRLDGKGRMTLPTALHLKDLRGPEELTCEVEVTDVSRRQVAGRATAIVHPAEIYVAIKRRRDSFVKLGDKLEPEILVVDVAGKPLPKIAVKLELIERRWKRAPYGSSRRPIDLVVAGCELSTTDKPSSCALAPPRAGFYLVRASAADRRGNPAAAADYVHVLGAGAGLSDAGETLDLEMVPDRKVYDAGQTARVLVKSPFRSAEAMVTVERAGIFSQRVITLSGPTPTIDVPITEDLWPNAFVSVVLVRGRVKPAPANPEEADAEGPAVRVGYASLPLRVDSRRLEVTVTPDRTEVRPGATLRVDVDVLDPRGKGARAEVTLYAVDEGVLSLLDYKLPDPMPVFGSPRSLLVSTVETRESLGRILSPLEAILKTPPPRMGATSVEVSGFLRRDFRTTAYYNPSLITDDKGRASATFKLPDNLTAYRIMAVAATAGEQFGSAEARVRANLPLTASPAVPRVLRAGDTAEAGVVVTLGQGAAIAAKGPRSKIEVRASAEGVALRGEAVKTVELGAGESVEVRFPFAAERVGKARLRFQVKSGDAEDKVEVTRPILPPQALETVALYGETTTRIAEQLGDLSEIRGDLGGLEVNLSATALVGLDGAVRQLLDYPFGCTEQLASRLVPLLPLRDLVRSQGIALPSDVDKIITATVKKLLSHQNPDDGGFGLWPGSNSNGWMTAYAVWILSEAQARGVPVPRSAIVAGKAHMRGGLRRTGQDAEQLATSALILDVLSPVGAAEVGPMRSIFEQREKMPLFGRALLAHAMVRSKGDRASIDRLVAEIEGQIDLEGPRARAITNHGDYAELFDSEARTTALVLRALVAARPAHPLASKLVAGVLADRRNGSWRTTQESAWALIALDAYRRQQEKISPNFTAAVLLGTTEIHRAPFGAPAAAGSSTPGASSALVSATSIAASKLTQAGGAPLTFEVQGDGRLFYEARLRYARKQLPAQPLNRGFFVKKTLRPIAAEGLRDAMALPPPETSAATLRGGDLVLVDLVVVTTSPRDFVAIDDPLPAGLEPVDTRLATTSELLDIESSIGGGGPGGEPSQDGYQSSWFVQELRDDRVLFFVDRMPPGMYRYRYLARATSIGSFVEPPARAEEMYAPEIFGRTGARILKVVEGTR